MDPLVGDLPDADVLLRCTEILRVKPGLHTAAGDDDALVVDCTGFTIVPASSRPWRWPGSGSGSAA